MALSTRPQAGRQARPPRGDPRTAASLLGRREYASVTMAEIARQCGLAKGTLYLYFDSKEELFLATLEVRARGVVRRSAARWPGGRRFGPAFAHIVARSLARARPWPICCRCCTPCSSRTSTPRPRCGSSRCCATGSPRPEPVEHVVEGMRKGDGVRLLLRTHALVVGLRQMADPGPEVARVLAREDLAVLHVEFEAELAACLEALVRGMADGPLTPR